MNIRPFRYTDLEALIRIAEVSFAEEYTARGETPASFARQVRMVARGHMVPFKMLSALAGIQWELFVAEVERKVVGCRSYQGCKQKELSNLMVHPQHRRQGIGQALLEKRLQSLTEKGYPFVTTTILASNQASLANVGKQGFEVFDRFSLWESQLPLTQDTPSTTDLVTSRPVQPADIAVFKAVEAQAAEPTWLQVQGSAASYYFLPLGERLLNRFTSTRRWTRAFTKEETIVGFLAATTRAARPRECWPGR